MWRKLYDDGEIRRQFDNKRFAWIRNRVSDMGGIEWQDASYGVKKAAKWRASATLVALMREYGRDRKGCEISLSIDNNTQRKLGGSRTQVIESLWAEMPTANDRHVGLRPRMASPSDLRTDWDEKLREVGLERVSRLAA